MNKFVLREKSLHSKQKLFYNSNLFAIAMNELKHRASLTYVGFYINDMNNAFLIHNVIPQKLGAFKVWIVALKTS